MTGGADPAPTTPPTAPPTTSPRTRSRRGLLLPAVLATLGALAAGAVVVALAPPGPVDVALPPEALPDPVAAEPCGALATALPEVLGGLERRDTTVDDPRLAAWGTPAARLVCGVPVPSGARFRPAFTVEGVSWDYRDAGGVVEWTTVDRREVQVRLTVPTDYEGQEGMLVALAGPLTLSIAQVPLEENLPVDPGAGPPPGDLPPAPTG